MTAGVGSFSSKRGPWSRSHAKKGRHRPCFLCLPGGDSAASGYAVSKERQGPSGFCCRSEPSQGLAAGLSHEQGRSPNFFLAKGGLVLNAGTEVEVRNGAVS